MSDVLLGEKLRIGLSSAALNGIKNVYWSLFTLFGMVYLTDVIGLSPALAGTILFASLLFDALIDLPIGGYLDGLRGRLEDYGVILISSAGLSSLSLIAFYGVSLLSSGSIEIALLVGTLFAFRLMFSIFDVTENAINVRVMTNPTDRTLVSSLRKVAQSLATILLGASMGWVFQAQSDYGVRIAILASFASAILVFLTFAFYQNLRDLDRGGAPLVEATFKERLAAIRRAPGCWIMAGLAILEACGTTILMSGLIYYALVVLQEPAWVGAAVIAMTLSQIVGQPLWIWLARLFGKVTAFGLTHGTASAAGLIFAVFGGDSGAVALGLICLVGILLGGVSTLRWSLMPDIIDKAAETNRVRVESGMIGLVICAIQTGAALAAVTLGLGLSEIGYQAGGSTENPNQLVVVVVAPFIVLNGLSAAAIAILHRRLHRASHQENDGLASH